MLVIPLVSIAQAAIKDMIIVNGMTKTKIQIRWSKRQGASPTSKRVLQVTHNLSSVSKIVSFFKTLMKVYWLFGPVIAIFKFLKNSKCSGLFRPLWCRFYALLGHWNYTFWAFLGPLLHTLTLSGFDWLSCRFYK